MNRGLVYHAGGLGDFVLSLPAIFRVVSTLEVARWHWWGPADRLALLPGFLPAPSELLRSGHSLWGASPDPRATRFLDDCGAVLAFGGRTAPDWPSRLKDVKALPVACFSAGTGMRVPVYHSRQLDALGVPRPTGPWLAGWRRSVLPLRTLDEIVVHPGSGDARKNLPDVAWREILSSLKRETGAGVRVVLGPVEKERGCWKELALPADKITVCETLMDLLATLSRARIFLGNDSGASHLAGILGIPTVAVFGASDAVLWRPLGPRVRVVRTAALCAPCTDGGPFACEEARCLEAISARDVVREALALVG